MEWSFQNKGSDEKEVQLNILIVDDDPDQAELASEILKINVGLKALEVRTISDGEEAVHFLRREFTCWSHSLPHVILLDLHMPKVNGFEVLKFVKSHRRLRRIPVVIFSATEDMEEVARCYDLSANTFILKGFDRFAMLNLFAEYWSGACLPSMDQH